MSVPKDIDAVALIVSRKSGGEPEGAVLLRRGESVQVGRGSRNDIVIDNPAISRAHLTLTWAGDKITARDLGSLNGTVLNRHRLSADTSVQIGDVLKISDTRITILAPDSSIAKKALEAESTKGRVQLNAPIAGTLSVQDRLKTGAEGSEDLGGFGPDPGLPRRAVLRIVLTVAGCAFLLGAALVLIARGGV